MKLSLGIAALSLLASASALHFYFDTDETRCFLEELPSDTIVEGHYSCLLWDEATSRYVDESEIGIHVEVQEQTSGHTVVKTVGPSSGRFTFTSHEAGDHNICLHSNITGGFFSKQHMKMYLDINVGSAKPATDSDVSHVSTLASKLRELNQKVADIQREQRYMREVEITFRDASEATNARAVWWSILQIGILVGAAIVQMRYLRNYFGDKKLR